MKLYTIVLDSCHGTSGPMVLGNKSAGRTKKALPRFSHMPSSRCHVDAAPSRLGFFFPIREPNRRVVRIIRSSPPLFFSMSHGVSTWDKDENQNSPICNKNDPQYVSRVMSIIQRIPWCYFKGSSCGNHFETEQARHQCYTPVDHICWEHVSIVNSASVRSARLIR